MKLGQPERSALIEAAHTAYVRVPNEPHMERLGRVVDALVPIIAEAALRTAAELQASSGPPPPKEG